ncbi:18672_t:CDS:2, partial [Funneliformis geosporum]
ELFIGLNSIPFNETEQFRFERKIEKQELTTAQLFAFKLKRDVYRAITDEVFKVEPISNHAIECYENYIYRFIDNKTAFDYRDATNDKDFKLLEVSEAFHEKIDNYPDDTKILNF